MAITFYEEFIDCGFDLTHALQDAKKLQSVFKEKPDEIASKLLTLKDYTLFIPNVGIVENISISNMNLKGIKMFLNNYKPTINKECYLDITRSYENESLSVKDLIKVFDSEYDTFSFLLDEIKNAA